MNDAIYKAAVAKQQFADRCDHLGHLPSYILRDLARNDAAPREWRKAAIELMLDKGYKEVNHPDLLGLLVEVQHQREAKEEVQAIVESAIEGPLEDHAVTIQEIQDFAAALPKPEPIPEPPGPFKASFTTQSQNQDDVV